MEHIEPDLREKALLNNPKYIGTLELILLRNYYYRDNARKSLGLFLLLLLTLVTLIFILRYEMKALPEPKYFATTYDGTPLPRIPVRLPNMNDNALLVWATEATQAAYTLNFLNYRVALQNARSYFTKEGYEKFLYAFQQSKNLEAIKAKKMVVYTKMLGTPQITQTTTMNPNLTIDGAYTWQIEFPMALVFENSNPQDIIVQQNNVVLLVRRLSTLESKDGVGIDSMVLTPVGS